MILLESFLPCVDAIKYSVLTVHMLISTSVYKKDGPKWDGSSHACLAVHLTDCFEIQYPW